MKNAIGLALLFVASAVFAQTTQPTAQTVGQLSRSFQELQSGGFAGAQWHNMPPVGSNYVEVALVRRPCCDQLEYTALVPVGGVGPVKATDPNDAVDYFIKRTGGKTGQPAWAGPFSVWTKAAIADFAAQHEADLKSIPGVKDVKTTCMLRPNRCLDMLWVVPQDNVTIPQLDAIRQEIIKKFPELRNARVAVTFIMPA